MSLKLIITRGTGPQEEWPVGEAASAAPVIVAGSEPSAALHLSGEAVAAEQFLLIREGGRYVLLNRADGTVLNGEGLPRGAHRTLGDGDQIRVGDCLIAVALADADAGARDAADSPRSFASLLEGMRAAEDSFSFVIEGGAQGGARVPITKAEMVVGWDEGGRDLSFDPAGMTAPGAIIRKDWSGVVVEAAVGKQITVNGEAIKSARRLRHGDELALGPGRTPSGRGGPRLIFHEPASLIVLDSLLPQRLPPPVPPVPASTPGATGFGPGGPAAPWGERRYFGYFTLVELLMMAAGTLALTAFFFVILESV